MEVVNFRGGAGVSIVMEELNAGGEEGSHTSQNVKLYLHR